LQLTVKGKTDIKSKQGINKSKRGIFGRSQ